MTEKKAESVFECEVINVNRELTILHALKDYEPPFRILRNFHLVDDGTEPEATIVLWAGGREIHEADTGVGPVDALANTLKKALKPAFSFIDEVKLIDFSARIYESRLGTRTSVEVTVLLSDGNKVWKVSEASQNINQASFCALAGGYEYAILQRRRTESAAGAVASRRRRGTSGQAGRKRAVRKRGA